MTDEGGSCEYAGCWTVEKDIDIPIPTLVSQTNIPVCFGENPTCTGSLTIEVPDGATINWLNLPNSSQAGSSTITDLCEGDYQVEVLKDGCGFTHTFSIICCADLMDLDNEQDNSQLDLSGSVIPSSEGGCNGSITLNIDSNDAIVEWTEPTSFDQTGEFITDLCEGLYCAESRLST